MPELELKQKIEFNVDQMTIDRVEALAAINGLDVNAWFRRLVDELIAQSSRHMGKDHVEVAEVRKPVFEIIKVVADMLHPLRAKARDLLDSGLNFIGAKKPEEEAEAPKPKKIRGKKIKAKLEAIKEKIAPVKEEPPKELVIELAEEVVIEEAPVEVEAMAEPEEEVDEEAEKKKAVQKALLEEQERIKAALKKLEET